MIDDLAHAGHRQLQRARDRRRRKRQHMHFGAQLLQPLLVADAEMLLLVDDDEAEVLEARRSCRAPHGCRRRCRRPPSASPFLTSRCSAAPTMRESWPMRTGRPAKRWRKFWVCWRASSVVGTTIAVCLPLIAAAKAARSATSVLPKPTSPQTSRSIGRPAAEIVERRLDRAAPGPASRHRGSARRIRRRALRAAVRRGAERDQALRRRRAPVRPPSRARASSAAPCGSASPRQPSLSSSPVSEP